MEKTYPAMFRQALIFVAILWCGSASAEAERAEIQYGEFVATRTGAELVELLAAESLTDTFRENKEFTWYVYVPESYDPEKPAGLLVYISPIPQGYMPKEWKSVVDQQNLIVISAHNSGNHTRTKRRMLLAIVAPYVVFENYAIDTDRVYLSGFSGGGKVASVTAVNFPTLFDGAIFICGAEAWSNVDEEKLARANENRFVFVTGTRDFNRLQTKKMQRKFFDAGMTNSMLLNVPNMGHSTPGEDSFRDAILFLDEPRNGDRP